MARLTKLQKLEKAEQYLGLESGAALSPMLRIGRIAQAFNAKRKEFDDMEAMIASTLGNALLEKPRG